MTNKIRIDTLPVTEEFKRQKRLIQDRGELALIEDGAVFRHLGYFSLKKGNGYYRGGHYHVKKTERFYVISGKLRVHLADLETGEKSEVELRDGQRAIIYPQCAHRFTAVEDAQVIEYYDSVYDADDDVSFGDFRPLKSDDI